jgi:glycosyltransferase involved in cell wall biosynthesis
MPDMNALLTIAIPTFNRPLQLRNTLEVVLPQILGESRVRLLVLDNHSEVPAMQILAELGVGLNDQVSVIRHAINIGGNANIMRCFELCETEWIWVLSDDDKPSPDAVQTILEDAKGDHVFAFYNYPEISLPTPIPHGRIVGNEVTGLFNNMAHAITPLTLLSAGIYRAGTLRKWLPKGYSCLSSNVPHLVMAFAEIEAGGAWLLSGKTICNYCPPSRDKNAMYHIYFLGWPIAYLAFNQSENIDGLRRCLQVAHGPFPEFLLISFINGLQLKSFFSLRSGYFFRIMKVFYAPSVFLHPLDWMKWQMMTVASFFPSLFLYAVDWSCRALGRPTPCTSDRERVN